MVSPAQVKRFLAPLRERHPEFVYRHRRVYCRVGPHLAWGIHLDGTSSPGCLLPNPIVKSLFLGESQDDMGGCWFPEMLRRDRSKGLYYRWLEPESYTDFADAFEVEALPILNSIVTLVDYAERIRFPKRAGTSPIWITGWYPLGIALGRFDWVHENLGVIESGAALAELPDVPQRAQVRAYFTRVMEFVPLVRTDDRAGMIALLHELLRDDVRRFELEPYWKPEPFPIELME